MRCTRTRASNCDKLPTASDKDIAAGRCAATCRPSPYFPTTCSLRAAEACTADLLLRSHATREPANCMLTFVADASIRDCCAE